MNTNGKQNGLAKTPGGTDSAERHRRKCAACRHPLREEINHRLTGGQESIREIATRYGLSEQTVSNHRKLGLPERLAKGFAARQIAEDVKLAGRLELLLTEACDVLEASREGDIRERTQAIETARKILVNIGEVSGQLRPPQVQAMFLSWGVRNEEEVARILETHRAASEAGPEDAEADCIALARWLTEQDPGAGKRIVEALLKPAEASALAPGSTNGAQASGSIPEAENGHGEAES